MEVVLGVQPKRQSTSTRPTKYGRLIKHKIGYSNTDLENLYPHNLTFYEDIPNYSISLQDFENYALDRLKLLRTIERINLTSNVKYSRDWYDEIIKELKKVKLDQFCDLMTGAGKVSQLKGVGPISEEILLARKYDHISHYILRLAYCRTEDMRRWMIAMELDFFRFKAELERNDSRTAFMKAHNFPYDMISEEHRNEVLSELIASSFHLSPGTIPNMDFFKVPFHLAIDLVKSRKAYLKGGFVYAPFSEVLTIITSLFRNNLSKALAITNKLMPALEEDERLVNLLTDFDKRHTGNDFVQKNKGENVVTANMIPKLSQKSFPLCMKSLTEQLTTQYHLKHFGRLQLGLFFKGIGVPIDEAITFSRSNFVKAPGFDSSRFDKQYLYNIRHLYGQEGKRVDYTPYSCMKVIMTSVGPGDSHGCPFRHSDATPLRVKLAQADIPTNGIKEIMELVEKQHYQIACQKYFEWTHNQATVSGGVNHPNQYFLESQNVLLGKKLIKAEVPLKTTQSSIYPDGRTKEMKVEGSGGSTQEIEWMDTENDEADVMMSQVDESPQEEQEQ